MEVEHGVATEIISRFQEKFRLSDREADVVRLASLGHGCKEIAYELGCRSPTIDIYWTRIYRKTGCRSHLEVMAALLTLSMSAALEPAEGERPHSKSKSAGGGRPSDGNAGPV